MFKPEHTLAGMKLDDDPQKNEPGVHMRVLRILLPNNSHHLLDKFQSAIIQGVEAELRSNLNNETGR